MSQPVLVSRRLLLGMAALAALGSTSARGADDAAELVAVMQRYAAALRGNDVETLVSLYASNGVFMRENLPAVVGTEALRAAYRGIFATLKIDLDFDIQQVEVADGMAWLHATSKGRVKTLATGVEAPSSFNILAVFQRSSGMWKIRAYLYASDRPGTGTPQ